MRYVAFLRGINVGGNKKVPMAELKACLEKAGYKNVKTLLNSGNVAFEGDPSETKFEEVMESNFGFPVNTLIRSQDELKKLVESNPFDGIETDKDIRLYVTFLRDEPIGDEPEEFALIEVKNKAAFWYIDQSKGKGTLDVMGWWDKNFGKEITTRNWNTVVKSAQL